MSPTSYESFRNLGMLPVLRVTKYEIEDAMRRVFRRIRHSLDGSLCPDHVSHTAQEVKDAAEVLCKAVDTGELEYMLRHDDYVKSTWNPLDTEGSRWLSPIPTWKQAYDHLQRRLKTREEEHGTSSYENCILNTIQHQHRSTQLQGVIINLEFALDEIAELEGRLKVLNEENSSLKGELLSLQRVYELGTNVGGKSGSAEDHERISAEGQGDSTEKAPTPAPIPEINRRSSVGRGKRTREEFECTTRRGEKKELAQKRRKLSDMRSGEWELREGEARATSPGKRTMLVLNEDGEGFKTYTSV